MADVPFRLNVSDEMLQRAQAARDNLANQAPTSPSSDGEVRLTSWAAAAALVVMPQSVTTTTNVLTNATTYNWVFSPAPSMSTVLPGTWYYNEREQWHGQSPVGVRAPRPHPPHDANGNLNPRRRPNGSWSDHYLYNRSFVPEIPLLAAEAPLLLPEEVESINAHGCAHLASQIPGRMYCVPYNSGGMVTVYEEEQNVKRLCLQPAVAILSRLQWLTLQVLLLRTDEGRYLRKAIHWNPHALDNGWREQDRSRYVAATRAQANARRRAH